ncbi:MAG: AAA family ATPase [Bacteroidales bacterium]|nr:AAA family ATPase [Bacteroidales bacterium]
MHRIFNPIEEDPEFVIINFLNHLHFMTPREMYEIIDKNGYIGQEKARKSICLMAYRHINRLKKLYLDRVPADELPSKENTLLIGPTGCGKTYLIDLLFNKVIGLPHVSIDITSYSETGYVGQDLNTIITRLIHTAGSPALASIGVICIDEFDKLSSSKNTAVFAGAGTTKDVTGIGVQRELLKILESTVLDVPLETTYMSSGPRLTFSTQNIPVIACGAFSGFKRSINQLNQRIGFLNKVSKTTAKTNIAVSYSRTDFDAVANFENYGFMPELIGRFSRILPFEALGKSDLKQIFLYNTIKKYEKELRIQNLTLNIDERVVDKTVSDAFKLETGARGLKSALLVLIEDACFEAYSNHGKMRKISLSLETPESIIWRLE